MPWHYGTAWWFVFHRARWGWWFWETGSTATTTTSILTGENKLFLSSGSLTMFRCALIRIFPFHLQRTPDLWYLLSNLNSRQSSHAMLIQIIFDIKSTEVKMKLNGISYNINQQQEFWQSWLRQVQIGVKICAFH